MSLVDIEHTSTVDSLAVGLDDLEYSFQDWANDPVKPDVVGAGTPRELTMVELAWRLRRSQATLPETACAQLGLPRGTTIATASRELLQATIDPDGPHCSSFRAACYYLRGRAHPNGNADD